MNYIHNKQRIRLEAATAEKLVYVFSNLRFLKRKTSQRKLGRRQNDPLQLARLAAGSLAACGPENQQMRVKCM